MSELRTLAQIAKDIGCSEGDATRALKAAKIEPAHVYKMGRGVSKLYDAEAAEAVKVYADQIRREAEAEEAKAQAEAAKVKAAAPGVFAENVEAIRAALKELIVLARSNESAITSDRDMRDAAQRKEFGDVAEKLDAMGAAVAKLMDQNVLIFRALKDMETDHTARLARLQNTLADVGTSAPTAPPKAPAAAPIPSQAWQAPTPSQAPVPEAAKPLPRVAVLGVHGAIRDAAAREFSECFDLRFYDMPSARNKTFEATLSACICVVVVGAHVPTAVTNTLRNAGVRTLRVTGGLTMLKEKMTGLYVELTEAAAA